VKAGTFLALRFLAPVRRRAAKKFTDTARRIPKKKCFPFSSFLIEQNQF
jgi:hypothetical protein